jgi:hypothetical protein
MADAPQHIGEGIGDVLAAANEARLKLFGDAPLPCVPACESPTCRGCAASRRRAKEQAEAERRQRVADRAERLRGCGVPAKAAMLIAANEMTDTYSWRRAQSWHRSVLAERAGGRIRAPRVLVLFGPKDGCKTTAAGWLVDRWSYSKVDEWPRCIEMELLNDIWCAKDKPHELTRLRQYDLFTPSLLVLDDAGQESNHPDRLALTCEALDIILRKRCDADKHTVLTTNFESEALFFERYATMNEQRPWGRPRIAERLTEYALWVKCPVEGFRDEDRRADVLRGRSGKGAR